MGPEPYLVGMRQEVTLLPAKPQIGRLSTQTQSSQVPQWPGAAVPSTKSKSGDFPSGPMVKALSFHCRGHRLDPWLENEDPTCHTA